MLERLTQIFSAFKAPVAIALVAAAMLIAGFQLQAKPPTQEEGQKACRSDVIAHCKTAAMLGQKEKVQSCLRENRSEISSDCRNFLDRADAFKAQMKSSCGQDIASHCPAFAGNREGLRNCMKVKFKQLSPGCQEFLKSNRQ